MKWFVFIFIALISINSWSYKSGNKNRCDVTELGLKNCPLEVYGYKFHFLDDKILIHDGIWRTIEKFPLIGKRTEWKSISVKKINSQVFVQFYIWTEPYGEVEVQSLKWFIHKIDKNELTKLGEFVVQKRSRDFSKEGAYKYDRHLKHKLFFKSGKVYVQFNGKQIKL